jgi:hypothetical protein
MKFTAAELAEIRRAFLHRIATAPASPTKRPRQRPKPPPLTAPVYEPEYDGADVLRTREVAGVFGVTPRIVGLWAAANILPSFRTLGGQRRFRWGDVRRALAGNKSSIATR